MNRDEQQSWLRQFPCQQREEDESSYFYGFTPVARGDYVCCPGLNVWSISYEKPERVTKSPFDQGYNQPDIFNNLPGEKPQNINNFPPYGGNNFNPNQQQYFGQTQRPGSRRIDDDNDSHNFGNQYPNNGKPEQENNYPKHNYPGSNNPQIFVPNGNQLNFLDQYPPCSNNNQFDYQKYPSYLNPNCNNYQPGYNGNGNYNPNPTQRPPITVTQVYPGRNTPPTRPIQNVFPLFPPNGQPHIPNFNGGNGNGKAVGGTNFGNQCQAYTRMPPGPDSECCGLDMSDSQGITDLQNVVSRRFRSLMYMQNNIRQKRETENDAVIVDIDNRIAGGSETELNQFPWTVLLKITFDYGNNKTTFNCGGSIISSRYVLTAAHCVYEKGATLSEIEIYMAEYDKRTFPRDCKLNFNGKKTCIDNIIMYAENIIRHPEYDDKKLYNDIALIRLRGDAPYTEFIRPICLAPVNVDNQAFYDLPLPVTGWGRNGPYMSDIKQSTVVNLVPHNECQKYYPYLSSSHLCAAGKTGEDTCKGDSGGPLMMLYGGKYYVVGVVSGKRADSPCGTSVPSLYTNVFEYLQWIRNNIK